MSTPPWVMDWLSTGRYAKYLRAAGGDPARALEIYEWNARLAVALFKDLNHLEVGLRNSYDRALLAHPTAGGADWLDPAIYWVFFPKHMAPGKTGKPEDKNATPRSQIKKARTKCGLNQSGTGAPRGKVVAELTFGFWSYLTDSLHEKTLWVPALHQAFAPGADRRALHAALTELREVRNRIAHHEPIFDRGVENHRRRIVQVAASLSTDMKDFIVEHSAVRELLGARP